MEFFLLSFKAFPSVKKHKIYQYFGERDQSNVKDNEDILTACAS